MSTCWRLAFRKSTIKRGPDLLTNFTSTFNIILATRTGGCPYVSFAPFLLLLPPMACSLNKLNETRSFIFSCPFHFMTQLACFHREENPRGSPNQEVLTAKLQQSTIFSRFSIKWWSFEIFWDFLRLFYIWDLRFSRFIINPCKLPETLVLNDISLKLAPRGEVCPLGRSMYPWVNVHRFVHHQVLFRKTEGRTQVLHHNFTPRVQSSPLGAKFTPRVTFRPWGRY
jgi:hypothetical protein